MEKQFPEYLRHLAPALAALTLAGCGLTGGTHTVIETTTATVTSTPDAPTTTKSNSSSTTTEANTGMPGCDTWQPTAHILPHEYLDEVTEVMAKVNPATIGTRGAFEKIIRVCTRNNDAFTTTNPKNLNIRAGATLYLPFGNDAEVGNYNTGIATAVKKADAAEKKYAAAHKHKHKKSAAASTTTTATTVAPATTTATTTITVPSTATTPPAPTTTPQN